MEPCEATAVCPGHISRRIPLIGIVKNRLREGLPYPRGAAWDGKGTNFSLFSANATSANATKAEVCLFDSAGKTELERINLPEYTDQIFCRPGVSQRARKISGRPHGWHACAHALRSPRGMRRWARSQRMFA
jgi:pullulanase/glycogen debranching enzyme